MQSDNIPGLCALACRLIDSSLVRVSRSAPSSVKRLRGESASERNRIQELLLQLLPGLDRIAAKDAVAEAEESIQPSPSVQGDSADVARDCATLRALSLRTLGMDGGRPVAMPDPGSERVRRCIDSDALVAWRFLDVYHEWDDTTGPKRLLWPPILRLAKSPVEVVTRRPMAEDHLHLGGALPPGLLWLMAISRLVPISEVFPVADRGGSADEQNRINELWCSGIEKAESALRDLILQQYSSVPDSKVEASTPELRSLLIGLMPLEQSGGGEDVPSIEEAWPVDRSAAEGSTILAVLGAERRVLMDTLARYRAGRGSKEVKLLFQYLRVKNAFHFMLIHGEGKRGLSGFRETLSRHYFYFRPATTRAPNRHRIIRRLEERRLSHVLESYLWDACGEIPRHQISTAPELDLEIRVSMGQGREFIHSLAAWSRAICETVRRWERGNQGAVVQADSVGSCPEQESSPQSVPLRVGFIVHFHKDSADPRCEKALWQADGLLRLLADTPLLRPLIVGIDAAGDELSSNPRAFSEVYAKVRNTLNRPLSLPGVFPVRLGFTFHAGEDFRDLLTGVRHVDEAAHLLSMHSGDRIGHGMALGWPPEDFYRTRRTTYPRLGDHILDLLWARALLRASPDRDDNQMVVPLEGRLVERLRKAEAAIFDLDLVEKELDRDGCRHRSGAQLPNERSAVIQEEALLDLFGISTAIRGQMVSVDGSSPQWIELIKRVQHLARTRILRKHLIIEVNPSSNRFVGGFSKFRDLPCRHMNGGHLVGAVDRDEDLPIAIGTDDPGIFHTTLRNEYIQIGNDLLDEGNSVRAVIHWLDEARQSALDASFLPPWAPSGRALRDHLERFLRGESE